MTTNYQSSINLRQNSGAPGQTPYIGPNGNWFIGGTDTGVAANAGAVISPLAQNNDVLKFDSESNTLIPAGVTSPNDGEMKLSTNSLFLGSAHSVTSAGRNVVLKNMFSNEEYSPVAALVSPSASPAPTWRKYTDSGMTQVVVETVGTDTLVDPMYPLAIGLNRRVFSAEITPADTVDGIWFEVYVGATQVWRAFIGPLVAGSPFQFYMADYSTPFDLRDSDVTYIKIKGRVKGNALSGKPEGRAWYRVWAEETLVSATEFNSEVSARASGDSASKTYTDNSVSAEATARIAGDSASKSYTDSNIATEVANRNSAIAQEASARDSAILVETNARVAADAAGLAAAKAYADSVTIAPATPVARTLVLGTAYQATNSQRPAVVSVMVEVTYTVTLASAQADTVELCIGPTNAVATGAGVVVASWASGLTGIALTIGLASKDRGQLFAMIPAGWYFAVRRTAGTAANIVAAFDQSMRS